MSLLKNLNKFFQSLSQIHFIIIMSLLSNLIMALLTPVSIMYEKYIGPIGNPSSKIHNFSIYVFLILILSPILETLIFQVGTIKILRHINKCKNNNVIIIFISAIFFGISHRYSLFYMFATFILGLLFSYSFIIYERKSQSAFFTVFWIHSFRNFIALLTSIL